MKTTTRFELFYSGGGHGGPYHDKDEAIKRAIDLLKGGNDYFIEVRLGDFKTVIARIYRRELADSQSFVIV